LAFLCAAASPPGDPPTPFCWHIGRAHFDRIGAHIAAILAVFGGPRQRLFVRLDRAFWVERNRPAAFSYPIFSLIGNFHMYGLMWLARMDGEVARCAAKGAKETGPEKAFSYPNRSR